MCNCFTSGVRCLQDLLFIFEQEGLRSASVFSQGQRYHVTILHGAVKFSAGLRKNNIWCGSRSFRHFSFFAKTTYLQVDELRSEVWTVPCSEEELIQFWKGELFVCRKGWGVVCWDHRDNLVILGIFREALPTVLCFLASDRSPLPAARPLLPKIFAQNLFWQQNWYLGLWCFFV